MIQILIGLGMVAFAITGYFINHREEYRRTRFYGAGRAEKP
jgi:uncharacterized protein YneF (UPF0154 family)